MEQTMVESHAIDVLICGAGAAGLTLAIDLARCGVRCRVIDKAREPFGGSRGKGIQPRTQEIFDDLGILDRIVALGGSYPPRREYGSDGCYVESSSGATYETTAAEPYCMPLMIPQSRTELVMRDRLAEFGSSVEFGSELVGFEQDDAGISARVASHQGEERIRARYLVAADGGRSFVRHALDIGFPGKTLGVRAIVADVALTGLDRSAWHSFNSRSMETMMSLCPLGGTDLFQLQAPVPLEGDVDLSAAGLTTMVVERTGRKDIRIESVAWASAYNMNARLADRYRVGRVLLVGDAAHIHPPTGGQGLNTSVQDSYNLGWKLATVIGGGSNALLNTYEDERRPIAASVLGLSTKLLDAAKRGDAQRGREVQQLDIGYPASSLALQKPERDTGLLAGGRAPDAPIRGAAGQWRRLFDLFAGSHWTLLGYEVDRDRVRPRAGLRIFTFGSHADLIDECGHFRQAYGVASGDWVLVRPDGYIGAMVASHELPAFQGYLDRLLK
jgi:2-polyprenyl-6-methoxyphenol hydroxylase-like FAD-dependent oxidoreductase